MLVCVASGEPGKDDVLFTGRLARHLGAEIDAALGAATEAIATRERAERFLAGGVRTLAATGRRRRSRWYAAGAVRDEIMKK